MPTGRARPSPRDVDVVVECSGTEPGVRHGFDVLRRGGTFILVGLRGADITVRLDLVCFHEYAIRSGFASTPQSWATAMRLIWHRNVELAPLISEVLPLREWERAFNASCRPGRQVRPRPAPLSASTCLDVTINSIDLVAIGGPGAVVS